MKFNLPTNDTYTFHPLAELFPLMDKLEFNCLIASMEKNGYNEDFPILLFKGKILDGRNRYKASKEANVEPTFIEFGGSYKDAEVYNIEANMHRRHISKSQKAMIAAKAIQASRDSDEKNLSVAKARLLYGVSEGYIKVALKILTEDSEIAEHLFNGSMNMKDAQYRIAQIREARTPNEYETVDDSLDEHLHQHLSKENTQSSSIIEEFNTQPEATAQRLIDIQNAYTDIFKRLKECEEKNLILYNNTDQE